MKYGSVSVESLNVLKRRDEVQHHASLLSRFLFAAFLVVGLTVSAHPQGVIPTSHGDNGRTSANTNEVVLTPNNVNKTNFGRLFNYPIDYQSLAQPLYVPNVTIPGKGVHNVVYVATMADSVYAFDAQSNAGANASPLWKVNFTDPANGITTASGAFLPCATTEDRGPGFTQEGIVATPAIDTNTNTIYVVAKTVENGTVRHKLHALDLGSGQEKFGGPVTITATTTSNAGTVVNFNSLHQKNRPGLLLMSGQVYIAFGSNYCNDSNYSWVLGYDAGTLQQTGVFNTNPDHGLTSIWQAGGGLAADDAGYIYPLTSEGNFDVNVGGQGYTHAVLKLSSDLNLVDFFIPWSVAYLNDHDLDLSGCSPLIPPDQDGAYPHIIIASGKQGTIYVLDRDNLGRFMPNDSQIIQELAGVVGSMRGAPAYWNGRVYFSAKADYLKVFSLNGGMLSTAPIVQTPLILTGAHAPTISANGNTNGIVWELNGGKLYAYDAMTLKMLYNSHQKAGDALPPVSHFATQTVVDGRVYVATRTTLEVYGLTHYLLVTSGGDQTAPAGGTLPAAIQVKAIQGYTNQPFPGVNVTFSDGGKGGSFNPASAITDSNGLVSTTYTLPKKTGTYTITATASGFGNLTTTATATPGAPTSLISGGGANQTGAAGSVLPLPISAKVQDSFKNGVPGISVTFNDGGKGGTFNPPSAVTGSDGKASTRYTLPNFDGKITLTASSAGLTTVKYPEHSLIPANVIIVSGDNQSTSAGTAFPQGLTVKITNSAGTAVPGAPVTFSAPSGTFSANPVTTDTGGNASVNYTAGTSAGTVIVTATAGAATGQFHETVTAGAAASIAIASGNGQTGPAGTTLTQALVVLVEDQYSNPVSGAAVNFDDGGAGGSFSNANPVTTDGSGSASQVYTLPPSPGAVVVTASTAGVGTPAVFNLVAQ